MTVKLISLRLHLRPVARIGKLSLYNKFNHNSTVYLEIMTEIMAATISKLEAAVDDNEQIFFEIEGSLQMFLATTKHGRPQLFNDITICAEACIPKIKSSFLATNDCKFAKVVMW